MGRRQRAQPESGIHHVMNRGVDHAPIFFDDADRIEFGRRLADIHDRFGVTTLAYCLMGNHYHLLLRAPNGNLSTAMHHLGSVFVRHTNDRIGRDGPMFRSRYHSIPVTTDEYLTWVSRYIHRNPINILGGRAIADYRWSSYRAYLGCRRPAEFLDPSVVLSYFDHDPTRYAAFVVDDADDAPPRDSAASIRAAIAFAVAECDLVLHDTPHTAQSVERTALTLIHDALDPGELRDDVGRVLAYPTDVARRMALSRARRRAATDVTVQRVIDRVA